MLAARATAAAGARATAAAGARATAAAAEGRRSIVAIAMEVKGRAPLGSPLPCTQGTWTCTRTASTSRPYCSFETSSSPSQSQDHRPRSRSGPATGMAAAAEAAEATEGGSGQSI